MSGWKPPRETGNLGVFVITGMLMPWVEDEGPCLLTILGLEGKFGLPLFSTEEKLDAAGVQLGLRHTSVKQITDQDEFLSNLPEEVEVIIDPWRTPEGKARYFRVPR